MALNIGVNVIEVDGRASPTLVGAPTGVAGFLVRSLRGAPDFAVPVRGLSDFMAAFGTYVDYAFGAHAVRGFFENGGAEAHVVRVVGAGAVAAQVDLPDRAAVATLRVRAGRHGRPDPGVWANDLRLSIEDHPRGESPLPAQAIGTNPEPFALAPGQTLVINVDGALAPVTITFPATDFANIAAASAAEVAASIRRQSANLRAGATPTQMLVLASGSSGPGSRLVIAGTAAAALGLPANTDAALPALTPSVLVQGMGGFLPGSAVRLELRAHVIAPAAMAAAVVNLSGIVVTVNPGALVTPIVFTNADFVGGVGAITPGEVVAAINRQAEGRGFVAAINAVGRLVLMTTRFVTAAGAVVSGFGPTSTIALGPGAPDATAALGLAAAVPVPGNRQNRALAIVSERDRLVTFGATVGPMPANFARLQSAEFDLVVSRNGRELERFPSVSMENTLPYYVADVVNDQAAGSGYVTVTDLNSISGPAQDVPAVVAAQAFTIPGADGGVPTDMNYVGDPATHTGLYAFDQVAIQLLACPDTTSSGVAVAAIGYCETRGDAMFVGTAPQGSDRDAIKTYATALRGRKVFGALYAPWIQITNPLDVDGTNPLLWVPPVGHVLGTYNRIGEARGVWKAPAGDEARLRSALGVEFDMTDADHTDLVKNGGVNGIRAIPGAGIIVDASRSLSTDTRWLFVGVRRLFNFVKSTLRTGLRFVAQEPHSEELRRMVKFNVVTPFLLGLWRQGAFGTDPADQVFTVVCDETNNPPAEVNIGHFRIEVYFYPVKPAETILIVVGQQEAGASAAES
jgi:phage tail sheath protein FI